MVADVADRFDALNVVGAWAQFAPEAAHMIVDTAIEDGKLASQHFLEKLFARNDLSGLQQEDTQQIELGGC